MSLLDDLETLWNKQFDVEWRGAAYARLLAHIEATVPWTPPQQPGFGPWVEYKVGDKGPRVGDVVSILTATQRDARRHDAVSKAAAWHYWAPVGAHTIVAYCVKDEAP